MFECDVLWLAGGSCAAVRLGSRPWNSRLQRQAGHPVPASTTGRWPGERWHGFVTRTQVRRWKHEQQQWRVELEAAQSPPGQPESTAASELAIRGLKGDGEDQRGLAEEVIPEPAERTAASRAPPSPDHSQRLLQGHGGGGNGGGTPQESSPNPATVQPVWMKLHQLCRDVTQFTYLYDLTGQIFMKNANNRSRDDRNILYCKSLQEVQVFFFS